MFHFLMSSAETFLSISSGEGGKFYASGMLVSYNI